MKSVFKKIKTVCAECGTPLNGEDLLKRGDNYYCPSDYQRTSSREKAVNRKLIKESNFIKRILGSDTGNLTLYHDFTLWTATNATATSAKVWTATGTTGKISKDLDLVFGQWYKIKVTASPSAGTILCYNSTDATKQLGANSFETRFVALTEYIEFRNLTASTNTISLIEIRND